MTGILGVSHLVITATDLDAKADDLQHLGYRVSVSRDDMPNRHQKAPFISGPLPNTTTMRLLVSDRRLPTVEIMRENFPDAACDAGDLGAPPFDLEQSDNVPLSVVVGCKTPDEAVNLWKNLSFGDVERDARGSVVTFRDSAISPGLVLRYVQDRSISQPTWLNQQGMVCVAFLCRDASEVREHLADRGYDVGECFELMPASTPLRLFLMRNRSGEIYEFLSVA